MAFEPKFTISSPTTNSLTQIERARGFLDAAHLSDEWISNMQQRALVKEAYHTTHIEGTQLTYEQSEKLWCGEDVPEARTDDKKELLNYRKAFDLVAHYINDGGPVTEILIREIHKDLVSGVRGNSAAPGEYRKIPNYVVNSKTKEVIYTPPPANEVPILMAELTDWINMTAGLNPVILSGIAQFQFVHIHPFLDGNGRAARLLSTLCLYKAGYDFKRLFTISEHYDQDRSAYYKAIQSVRENDMDMTKWIEYFTNGLASQMQSVKEKGTLVIQNDILLAKARKKHGLKDRAITVLRFILEHEKATLKECEEELGINRRTLQRDLKLLVDAGLIAEVGATTDPNRYYKKLL